MATTTTLPLVITEHVAAVNAFDVDRIVATFAENAFVNDVHREIWGPEKIRAWGAKELIGDRVTMEVTEVLQHGGLTVVRARYDGEYDKSALPPGELILTNYFNVVDGKIASLIIIYNTDSPY